MAFRLHTPPRITPPAGSARVLDVALNLLTNGIGNTVTVVTQAITRSGQTLNTFLTSAAGAFGVRGGRACNVHTDGQGALLREAIPHHLGTAHGGARNPDWMGVVGLRVVLAINAQMDADATAANEECGVVFFPADLRAGANYHQLINDSGNNRDRGFGLVRYQGKWRVMWRQLDNDGNAIPPYVADLPWPTADVEQFVTCDFVFRQQTATRGASVELWLDGAKVWSVDWSAGSTFPRPDTGARGDGYGWACLLRSISGPVVADGRELRIAGIQYVAGPDTPGVLWQY